jgi:CubicO group peptidase (beta-lactamase class C family)
MKAFSRFNRSMGLNLCWLFLVFGTKWMPAEQTVATHESGVESNLQFQNEIRGKLGQRMRLEGRMNALHVPGVSIAVIHRGAVEWAKGYGAASLDGAPVSTSTLFNAASMTKPLTAVGVLRLVQIRKINLDAPVNNYLKRWKIPENKFTAGHPVTIRQLLTHTSGIGTHEGQVADPDAGLPNILQVLDGQKPATTVPVRVEAQPGTKYAYSNGGYAVLQLLIEDVSGKPFAQYMQQAVLSPLHMDSSTFEAPLSPARAARAATGYWADGVHGIAPAHFVKTQTSAGGLWTTPTDYAKFIIELQRDYAGTSHRLLNQKMAREMMTAGMGPSPSVRWGLGVRVGGTASDTFFEHGGSGVFQNESIGYLNGDGIVILTNGGGGGDLVNEVARSAASVYNWPDFHSVQHTLVSLQPGVLEKFVGTYDFIKITREYDRLMAEIPLGTERQQVFPEAQDQFFLQDAPTTLKFDLNDKGECTGVEFITSIVHLQRPKTK